MKSSQAAKHSTMSTVKKSQGYIGLPLVKESESMMIGEEGLKAGSGCVFCLEE
jgi:hypothetical protein